MSVRRAKASRVGVPAFVPLLVKFPIGKGQVIFTSFHNDKQNNETEKKLLQYLVFTMVTAGVEAQVPAGAAQPRWSTAPQGEIHTPHAAWRYSAE